MHELIVSRDPRAFAQELRVDAANADAMGRALRERADELDPTDSAIAREAERVETIRASLTDGYVGLLRASPENF